MCNFILIFNLKTKIQIFKEYKMLFKVFVLVIGFDFYVRIWFWKVWMLKLMIIMASILINK